MIFSPKHRLLFEQVVIEWIVLPEWQVIWEDFLGFQIETLIHRTGWERVVAKLFSINSKLVNKFYMNFNLSIDEPSLDNEY